MDKPIPAFYACYLLRSTVRHASLYVGSTPNPLRRLRQHNGDTKGGAARTSRDSLRPWEMTCLVSGFPSKIAALQFEWAWQNTHLTRHVSPDSRLSQARSTLRFSPKTGRMRKRTERPRMSLSERLSNLHLLLRTSSFERWPLRVTFYAEDVYRVWLKCAAHHLSKLRPGIRIVMDESSRTADKDVEQGLLPPSAKGIYAIDVGYSGLKAHLQKSRDSSSAERPKCGICHDKLPKDGAMSLVCPNANCSTRTHLRCLASTFMKDEKAPDTLVPISGRCPGCKDQLQWVDLVKEMSLRTRGQSEVDKIFKVRKPRAKKAENSEKTLEADSDSDDEIEDPPLVDDEWHQLSSSDVEVDCAEERSDLAVKTSSTTASQRHQTTPPSRVVEDSDWDDAEVIT